MQNKESGTFFKFIGFLLIIIGVLISITGWGALIGVPLIFIGSVSFFFPNFSFILLIIFIIMLIGKNDKNSKYVEKELSTDKVISSKKIKDNWIRIDETTPPIKELSPYANVRKKLIGSGWTPIVQNDEDCGSLCESRRSEDHYLETVFCMPTGLGYCGFEYENHMGKHMMVITDSNLDLIEIKEK